MSDELIVTQKKNDKNNKEENNTKKSFSFDFYEYKSVIYTALFYSFGLFIGSYFYKISATEMLNELLKPQEQSLINLFISNFCVYFSLYVLVVFLGFCLIGYPIINIIPTVIGIVTGLKAAYLFINYSVKGVGYSLIMLIPFAALFLTVIAFTINESTSLSKKLISITKNTDEPNDLNLKPYVKKYLILALCILLTSFVNACLTSLLFTVVSI